MARKSDCELVRKREIKHIPKDHKDRDLPNCLGYIDKITEDALDECRKCEWFWRNEEDGKEGDD